MLFTRIRKVEREEKYERERCKYNRELKIGTKIEMEHTHLFPKRIRPMMAKKIARDHLNEFKCYYTKGIVPMEKHLKSLKGGY